MILHDYMNTMRRAPSPTKKDGGLSWIDARGKRKVRRSTSRLPPLNAFFHRECRARVWQLPSLRCKKRFGADCRGNNSRLTFIHALMLYPEHTSLLGSRLAPSKSGPISAASPPPPPPPPQPLSLLSNILPSLPPSLPPSFNRSQDPFSPI